MSDLEPSLRRLLDERAASVADDDGRPPPAVLLRARQRRLVKGIGVGLAAVVVVVGLGVQLRPADHNADVVSVPHPTTGGVGQPTTTCADPATSSPADFDPQAGTYAVYLYGVDASLRTVAFDVIQFLRGDDASTAYHRDNPSDPGGPPGRAYVVNAFVHTDQAAVGTGAGVRLLDPAQPGTLVPGSLDDLPTSPRGLPGLGLYWLSFRNGAVTQICQQDAEWRGVDSRAVVPAGAGVGVGCTDVETSSRGDFDPRRGQYAVYLYGVNAGLRTVAFDVVQFLRGDDAALAYRAANPGETDDPPDGYFVENSYEHTDQASVDNGARVRLLDPAGTTTLVPAELADVTTHLPGSHHPGYGLYWLTLEDGHVTDVCQQYTP